MDAFALTLVERSFGSSLLLVYPLGMKGTKVVGNSVENGWSPGSGHESSGLPGTFNFKPTCQDVPRFVHRRSNVPRSEQHGQSSVRICERAM